MISEKYRSIVNAILVALVSLFLIGIVHNAPVFRSWELRVDDIFSRSLNNDTALQDEAVIVTIDQNSLNTLKNRYKILWPFPRLMYSYIIDYLNYCNASSIVFDVLLPQSDITRTNINAEYSDSLFSRSMRKAGNVVLAMQMEDSSHATDNQFHSENLRNVDLNIPPKLISHNNPSATLPLPRFQKAARLPGIVNFHTDIDGICRRIPLFYKYENSTIPFLALSALMVSENIDSVAYDSLDNCLKAGSYQIPLTKNGFFNIKWYGPGGTNQQFKYISFANLIHSYRQWQAGQEPKIDKSIFEDKTVFIGATAAGLWDMKPTPFSSQDNPFPGVEIYATVFSNFVNGDTINQIGFFQVAFYLFFIMAGFNYLWPKWNIYYSGIMTLALLGLPIILNIISFQNFSTLLPLIPVELSILLSLILIVVVNYLTVNKRKKIIKNVFSRYMHPEIVEELTRDISQIKMGGKEIEATVLFTDLQSFTNISEDLQPGQIVELLNSYFEKAEKIIFNNSGMLDKYTGDGLMAIYGAPIYSSEHAIKAGKSILEFEELGALDIKLNGRSIPLITRIGGASGKFVVGNIGSPNRMDYTAVGDTVNLAARLEGVNKQYGTNNLISNSTYELIKDHFVCREVDHIRVKGRQGAVKIYNVICRSEELTAKQNELLEMHNEALLMYKDRKFEKAGHLFAKMQKMYKIDNLSEIYKKRCEKLLEDPDIIDEDNIFNMTIK